jgi:PIN domain nuclease of toxin-antitoxin system
MRLLLDTHALLWWFTDDAQLSATARAAIADEANEIFVSAVSAWEIATKQRIGKLALLPEASARFGELVAADGFTHLPVNHLHSLRAGSYAVEHRDPFDRMLAAQSELEGLLLVSCDRAFAAFACRTLW